MLLRMTDLRRREEREGEREEKREKKERGRGRTVLKQQLISNKSMADKILMWVCVIFKRRHGIRCGIKKFGNYLVKLFNA